MPRGDPRVDQRTPPKLGPSDTSDSASDRPDEPATDTDAGGTGERVSVGARPSPDVNQETGTDRVVGADEAGLGGGLDEAEEARQDPVGKVRKPKP